MPYVGEIRTFAFTLLPKGWLACDGSVLDIMSYRLLYSVVGNTYGGDGRHTFGIPDLRGRTMASPGGTEDLLIGETQGSPTAMLTEHEMPNHNHSAYAGMPNAGNTGVHQVPADGEMLTRIAPNATGIGLAWCNDPMPGQILNQSAVTYAGLGQPIDTYQPYIALTACIAYEGSFPGPG